MDHWTVAERTIAFDHPFVRIVVDRLVHGEHSRMYTFLESPVDAANVLALTADRQIVLTRQFRHPIGQIIFDLPAGRMEPGEDPIDGARRELQEETGYHAGSVIPLATFNPFPGSLKVTAHLFFASDLVAGDQRLDQHEELEVHHRPFDEVYAEVVAGQHIDVALQMAVLMARARGLA